MRSVRAPAGGTPAASKHITRAATNAVRRLRWGIWALRRTSSFRRPVHLAVAGVDERLGGGASRGRVRDRAAAAGGGQLRDRRVVFLLGTVVRRGVGPSGMPLTPASADSMSHWIIATSPDRRHPPDRASSAFTVIRSPPR